MPERVKKSYSISQEAEQFVRRIRKSRQIASDSEALDQLLRESMVFHDRGALDEAYMLHYDALSDEARGEESVWADFAATNLMNKVKG